MTELSPSRRMKETLSGNTHTIRDLVSKCHHLSMQVSPLRDTQLLGTVVTVRELSPTVTDFGHLVRLIADRDNDFDDRIRERMQREQSQSSVHSQNEWKPPSADPLEEVRRRMGWKQKKKRRA